MAVQGEELASKIEARIKQAIDSVVDDIRVSLDDVREAVNSQFDAALQSVLADAKSLSLQSELEEMLADVPLSEEPVAPAQPQPSAGPAKGSKELKQAIQEIERGGTQVDVLNALLDQLLVFGSRAALLILKGDTFSGWKGKGFSASGGNDEMIKRFSAGPGDISELDRLRLDESVVSWDGGSFAQRSNMTPPESAVAVPMVIKDKIAAAVYVDSLEDSDNELDQNSVELLVYTTGLLIDTLAIRKRVPSPTLSRDTDADPFDSEAEPQLSSQPEMPPTTNRSEPARTEPEAPAAAVAPPPPPSQVQPPSVSAPPPMAEPVSEPEPEPEPQQPQQAAPQPAPAAQPSTQVQPPEQPSTQVQPPQPPQAAPEEKPAGQAPSTQVRPPAGAGEGSTQYVPPPGVTGGFAAKADVGEEAKKHDDARRFARLLVSEIKLYNEGKVDQGRKNGDLYERLKEDIDRSRQMYEDRVPQEVREVSNYFYDELVRILADGNADALGL